MPKAVDHTGKVFGRLTATERLARKGQHTRYRCTCECGHELVVLGHSLASGNSQSCGCSRIETRIEMGRSNRTHGGYAADASPGKRQAFAAWRSAKKRCYDPKSPRYVNYGQRGIVMCDEWLTDPDQFYTDMGDPPEGCSLNRIDNDGSYTKENCEWADAVTQANNKSNNVRIAFDGRTQTVSEWAREIGMRPAALNKRLKRGWTADEALTTTSRGARRSGDHYFCMPGLSPFTISLLASETRADLAWRHKAGLATAPTHLFAIASR